MINIFYCDLTWIKNDDLGFLMAKLPDFMQEEIRSYKRLADQKARLMARIVLLSSLTQTGSQNLIYLWKKEKLGKPFINGWDFFSISHSGNYVVFCHGPTPIGIDIEIKKDLNIEDLDSFLHPEEKDYIFSQSDRLDAFYSIWVKKESFLKATSQGLVSEINIYNAIEDSMETNL